MPGTPKSKPRKDSPTLIQRAEQWIAREAGRLTPSGQASRAVSSRVQGALSGRKSQRSDRRRGRRH